MQELLTTPPRVLLADDEETFLLATAELFKRSGVTCFTAHDAQGALQVYKQEVIDVVVSDIRMPGNEELELVRHLNDVRVEALIVLITGYPTLETAIASVRLPVFDYLSKPVRFDALLRTVKAATQQSRANRMLQDIRRRLSAHQVEVQLLDQVTGGLEQYTPSRSELDVFVAALFNNLAATLTDLIRLIRAASGLEAPEPNVCRTMACPRLNQYREAIEMAIRVLEDTKQSFKSKELGQLKRNLTNLIEST